MHFYSGSHIHKDMFTPTKSYTHIQSRCAMTQRGAAGVKAPVAVVSCHHLEECMSPCLLSLQHKSPPNNWVSVDQHVFLCHLVSTYMHACVMYSIQPKRDAFLVSVASLQSHF